MKTRVEALALFPSPARAANEDFAPVTQEAAPSGWNAYEVWRTRIKALQDPPNRTTRPG